MLKVPSCKLYIPMEGNANDASGNGNNGTVSGATLATGKFGKCYSFDGIDDCINCGSDSSLNITGALTVECWVKKAAHPTANRGIFDKWWNYTGHLDKRCFDLVEQSNYKPYFAVSDDGTGVAGHINYAYANTELQLDTWYHIAGVYIPSTSLSIYINAILESINTTSIIGSIYSVEEPVIIGATYNPEDSSRLFKGLIDEVRVYNKALSQTDIKRIMMGLHPIS